MLVWKPSHDGSFSSATTWDVIRVKAPSVQGMNWIWHGQVPKKMPVCVWKEKCNCFLFDDRLQSMCILIVSKCDYCSSGH